MLAIAPGCELDVERGPDWLLVRVRSLAEEQFDTLPLADELWSLLERHSLHRLVLELDRVPTLTRHLLDELGELEMRLQNHGGLLRLCGLSPQSRRALRMCDLSERIHPYGSRQEAVMGCEAPRRPR